jgi:hypothetical protein
LTIHGNLLVTRERGAKPNVVHITVLDLAQKGKVMKKSDAIEFPAWVTIDWQDATFEHVGGAKRNPPAFRGATTLRREVRIEKGKVLFAWEADGQPRADEGKAKSGIAEMDLETGKVRMLPADKKLTELKELKEIVVGDRKFTVADITKRSGTRGISTTSTVPTLQAFNTNTNKLAWQRTLRGGSTTTVNQFAP